MEQSPNEELTPYYDGDKMTYITVTEYYNRVLGHFALEVKDGE